LPKDSAANVSQILALNRSLLSERAGRLAPKQLAQFSTGSMSSSADDFAVFVPYFAEGEPLPPPDEDLCGMAAGAPLLTPGCPATMGFPGAHSHEPSPASRFRRSMDFIRARPSPRHRSRHWT
jgi:hypothetical protein